MIVNSNKRWKVEKGSKILAFRLNFQHRSTQIYCPCFHCIVAKASKILVIRLNFGLGVGVGGDGGGLLWSCFPIYIS